MLELSVGVILFGVPEPICIGVAPITQHTHVRNKKSNIQGRSPNVVKTIFHTLRNYS